MPKPAAARSLAVQAARAPGVALSPDQLALVRRTIAQGATDDELALYLYDCQRHGVHPLDKLLHFTKRGGKYVPITSIDLMRTRAADTGECLGISDAEFLGTPKDVEFAATVTVRRFVHGQAADFTATARWAEYYPGDGPNGIMWRKMPHTMLGKCAEGLALRKGFPKQLAGLYAREELDQARPEGDAPRPEENGAPALPDPQPTESPAPEPRERAPFDEEAEVPIDQLRTTVLALGKDVEKVGGKGTGRRLMAQCGFEKSFLDLAGVELAELETVLVEWLEQHEAGEGAP
jgi:phage recombination protein Bet